MDVLDLPLVVVEVLHPLEVGDHDAAGVGEDVGEHLDAPVGEDPVGRRSARAVGRFDDQLALDPIGVLER